MSDGVAARGETRAERRVAALLLLGFLAWTAAVAATSSGILEADETMHWLYARHAASRPWNLLHPWARPLYTTLLWPFALGGFAAGKALSVLAAAAAAAGAWRAGVALGRRHAGVAVAAVYVQPFVFQQTYGVWTEIVFAAFVAWWAWALAARRPRTAAAFASLLPLVRPEGAVFVGVTFLAAICGLLRDKDDVVRRRGPALLAPLGAVAWWGLTAAFSGDPAWLVRNWPWKPDQHFGVGDWGWLADVLPQVAPAALWPLVVLGVAARGGRRVLPVVAAAVGVLGVHATLWAVGAFGSAGYARYFVTLAPCFALAAAGGVDLLVTAPFVARRGGARVSGAATAVVAAALAVASLLGRGAGGPTRPSDAPPDARLFGALGAALEADAARRGEGPPLVYAAHPFAYLRLSRVPEDRFEDLGSFGPDVVRGIPAGGWLLVENRFFATRPSNVRAEDLPSYGFTAKEAPPFSADLTLNDPRHDPALRDLTWSLWRREGP